MAGNEGNDVLESVTTTKRMRSGDEDKDQFVEDQVHNEDWVNKDWVVDDLIEDKDQVGDNQVTTRKFGALNFRARQANAAKQRRWVLAVLYFGFSSVIAVQQEKRVPGSRTGEEDSPQ